MFAVIIGASGTLPAEHDGEAGRVLCAPAADLAVAAGQRPLSKGGAGAHALPHPPAVGVWIITASSASMTVASQPYNRSMRPSLRRTQFSPPRPALPPSRPGGGTRRWPDRMVRT